MDNKITKRLFIEKLSRKLNCEYDKAAIIYKQFIGLIIEELLAGSRIVFTGFGSFEIKAHKGHALQFGGKTYCGDYRVLTFRVAKSVKGKINQ